VFGDLLQEMGIKEAVTAPPSPWQNGYVERVIGSVRRECLDHVNIFDERHLRDVLSSYFQYYHSTRTHLLLDKNCPESRPIHPPEASKIVAFPAVGGLQSVASIIVTNGLPLNLSSWLQEHPRFSGTTCPCHNCAALKYVDAHSPSMVVRSRPYPRLYSPDKEFLVAIVALPDSDATQHFSQRQVGISSIDAIMCARHWLRLWYRHRPEENGAHHEYNNDR